MTKSQTLNKILNKIHYSEYGEEGVHYKRYTSLQNYLDKEKVRQISLKDMINIIKTSEYYEFFVESINNIKLELIYTSDGHGEKHNERVAIFVTVLAILNKLDKRDLKILLEAAKYHDIGRTNDEEDAIHGYKAAMMLDKIIIDMTKEDKTILQVICIVHSLADNNLHKIVKKYNIKDEKRCKKLLEILKDADALDRTRLETDSLDIKYLRNKYSKQLIVAAYDLFYNY